MSNSRQFIILFTKKCIAHDEAPNKLPPVKGIQDVIKNIVARTGVKNGREVHITTTVTTAPASYLEGVYENNICITYGELVPEMIYVYTYNEMGHLDHLKEMLDAVALSTDDSCEYGKTELFDNRVLIPIDNPPLFKYLCGLEIQTNKASIKAVP